jgi:hypothetical protein
MKVKINHRIEIDYRFNEFTGGVAYVLLFWSDRVLSGKYISPYVFTSLDDAYHAACIEIAD